MRLAARLSAGKPTTAGRFVGRPVTTDGVYGGQGHVYPLTIGA